MAQFPPFAGGVPHFFHGASHHPFQSVPILPSPWRATANHARPGPNMWAPFDTDRTAVPNPPNMIYNNQQPLNHRNAPNGLRRPFSDPSSRRQVYLKTESTTYSVIRSLDPRGDIGDDAMSAGIFLIREVNANEFAVQKKIKMHTPSNRERVRAEVRALRQIKDYGGMQHLNDIMEQFWDGASSTCSLILGYCNAGTLDDLILRYRKQKKVCPEDFAWHAASGMAKALAFIHYGINWDSRRDFSKDWNTICHLDIKPGNVFLAVRNSTDKYPAIVLGDFGCAVSSRDLVAGRASYSTQANGTPGWFPPEHKDVGSRWFGRYGAPTDVWQMGGVIQTICLLEFYPNKKLVKEEWPCGRTFSDNLNVFVASCMDQNYEKRIPTLEAVEGLRRVMKRRALRF